MTVWKTMRPASSKTFSISTHICSYCSTHSKLTDLKGLSESKSQIFIHIFHQLFMLREMKLVLKSIFEWLPYFEPLFTQFTQYAAEDLVLKVWGKKTDFLSQFRYAKLIETIFNAKLYAFDDAFAHITQLREDTHAFRVERYTPLWKQGCIDRNIN